MDPSRSAPNEELENIRLAELIKEYDERFCHILGYRRMTSWINHFNHTQYSKNRVHRIMKKLGIHSVIRKKKKKIHLSQTGTKQQKIYFKEISTLLFPIKMGYGCNGIQSPWREKEAIFKCHYRSI